MKLQQTKPCDIDDVMRVIEDGRAALANLGIDQWQTGSPNRTIIEGDIKRGESYLVRNDQNAVVATAMMTAAGEPDYDEIEGAWLTDGLSDTPDYLVVHRVAVASDQRGKGLARYVLNAARSVASSHQRSSIRIDTHPGNVPMQRLLVSEGFTCCGTITMRFPEGATPQRLAYEKLL